MPILGADGLYVGAAAAEKAYVGAEEVWAAEPPGTPITGLILPGTSGNYVSTPDGAAVSTGSPDIRLKLTLPNWNGTFSFASKYGASGQISWRFRIQPLRTMTSVKSLDGSGTNNNNGSVQAPFSDGQTGWVRLIYNPGSDVMRFQTSADGSTWSNNGNSTALGDLLFDSTAPLVLGAGNFDGTHEPLAGTIHYAELRNGEDGPVVAKFDPTTVLKTDTRTPSSFASSTGETWTVSGSGWDWAT